MSILPSLVTFFLHMLAFRPSLDNAVSLLQQSASREAVSTMVHLEKRARSHQFSWGKVTPLSSYPRSCCWFSL